MFWTLLSRLNESYLLPSKVAPIKRLTIPRLELSGAHLLTWIIHHVQQVFHIPLNSIYAWTDGMVILSCLTGTPDVSSPMLGTDSHISSSQYLLIDGIMSAEQIIQQTVLSGSLPLQTVGSHVMVGWS